MPRGGGAEGGNFPAVRGLYQCPTIVNNVETLCDVKHILAMGGGAELIGCADNRGHMGRDVFRREVGNGLAVDQQPIAAEDHGGIDAVALANGCHEVADGGHGTPGQVGAKLGRADSEVKP